MSTTFHPRRPLRPTVSLVGAGALVLGLLPASVAADEHAEPRDTDLVCQEPYDSEFDDVDDDNTHYENILCAADHEIARGHGDGTYRPRDGVRRDQMASFVTRLIETASGEELEDGDDEFDDVHENSEHAENIRKLANIEVVEGFEDGDYRPRRIVTRDQMGSFIARAISYLDNEEARDGSEPPEAEDDHFDDVGEESRHHAAVNALAEQQIVVGDGEGNYRPRNDVRRDQMGSFLMRGYDYAVEAGLVAPPLPDGDNGDNGDADPAEQFCDEVIGNLGDDAHQQCHDFAEEFFGDDNGDNGDADPAEQFCDEVIAEFGDEYEEQCHEYAGQLPG